MTDRAALGEALHARFVAVEDPDGWFALGDALADEARAALAAGDLDACACQLAGALAIEPMSTDRLELFDVFLDAAAEAGVEALPPSGEPEVMFEALRILREGRRGDRSDALRRLFDHVQRASNFAYLEAWGLDWATEDDLREIGHDAFFRMAATIVQSYGDPAGPQMAPLLGNLAELIAVGERVFEDEGALRSMRLAALGKAGRYADAIALGRQSYEERPNWHNAIGAAMACRRSGDLDGALAMFALAADHDPADVTALLDSGDIELDRDRFAEALAIYERALERQPQQAWAQPSAAYCRFRLDGDEAHREQLTHMATDHGDECTCGCRQLFESMFGQQYGPSRMRERAAALLERL